MLDGSDAASSSNSSSASSHPSIFPIRVSPMEGRDGAGVVTLGGEAMANCFCPAIPIILGSVIRDRGSSMVMSSKTENGY